MSILQLNEIWRGWRTQFFLVVAAAEVIPFLFTATATAAEPKRVLIVHSFGRAAPLTGQSQAFESELVAKMGEPVDLDEVSMDIARYADSEMQEAVAEYLEKHRAKWRPDLVVPMAAPASMFVAKYRDRLFPDTPVLYLAADPRLIASGALDKNAVYVGQKLDIPGLFEDMLQVAPATKNIAVVIGTTPLERTWQEAFQKAAEPYAGRIKFTYYNDLSFEQMQERAATLPPDSFIFFFTLFRDAAGVTYATDEVLRRLADVANAPINSIFAQQLGTGIVGGRLYPAELVGKEGADVAVRILHGEPASSFPPKLIDRLPPRYDWRALKRWKINEKLLPPGSTVLFREPTVWERYRAWIIGGLSIFILQGLLITGLLFNLIRRRRAERFLSESEKRFQTMADAAPVLIWMAGEDKLCTFFNKGWLEFTGRSMEQELGKGWNEGVHPDDLAKTFQTYSDAVDRREPFVMQYRLKNHDGEYRWITDQGVPRYGSRGKFRGYVGACVDITDLLKKEAALRESEERIALAAEVAQVGVWALDTVTNELWISDKIRELFQFGDEEKVTYEMLGARVHPEDRAMREAVIRRAIDTKSGYDIEFRLLLPDGAVRWISGRTRCLDYGDGKSVRLLSVAIDVTKRKRAEEEARRQREQINLLSRVSLLGEMTASLAHELNQPLSAIITNGNAGIRFIDKGKGHPTIMREILADVVSAGRRAHEIIQTVRNTVKKGDPSRRRINLNEMVSNIAYVVRPDAAAHSCEVETSLARDLPLIEGDPVQIQQVLVNLVTNAFDAMRQTPVNRRKVEISTGMADGEVRLSVRDHGTGIRAEVHDHLFDRFFTTKEQGLGMGLAIVRSIVEAHGGQIGAENVSDGGARFYFTLPVTKKTD